MLGSLLKRRAAELRRRSTGYESADVGPRTAGWNPVGHGPNALGELARGPLRRQSRDLRRSNPYAWKALTSLTSNMVGVGFQANVETGDEALNTRVEALWALWAETSDFDEQLDFAGQCWQVTDAWLEGGEVFVLRETERTASGIPLSLRVVESELCDSLRVEETEARRIVSGVEFDARGKRAAYWMRTAHPDDLTSLVGVNDSVRVPARDVAHVYLPQRPGQVRGLPWLAPVLLPLREIDDYRAAERMRKRIESCMVAFVSGGEGDPNPGGMAQEVIDVATGLPTGRVSPGLIARVPWGQEVRMHSPAATGGYAEWLRAELQGAAAGMGVSYEQLGDLSQTNYTSLRAGLIEFRRLVMALRSHVLRRMLLQRVWGWFLEACYLVDLLPRRVGGYPVTWVPHRFESVDRAKDAAADVLELENLLTDYPTKLGELGRDWRQVVAKHAEGVAAIDKAGLSPSWRAAGAAADGGGAPGFGGRASDQVRIAAIEAALALAFAPET